MTDQTDNGQRPDESGEMDAVLDSFQKAESARRRRGILYASIALIVAAAVFAVVFVFRVDFFQPNIDVEKGEEEVIAKTNDPQCRDMIAQVQQLSDRYFKLEPTIDEKLLGDDPEAIQKIRDEIARLQQRLDEIEEFSQKANLRFDESRQQLDDWFDYMALEFSFVDRLAKERLAELKAEANAAKAGPDAGQPSSQPSDKQAQPEGVVVEEGDKKSEDEANKKTPEERKQGALVAIHDAFQKFRVWHSSSLHPCGAADEGETPWTPDESGEQGEQGKPDEQGKQGKPANE